MPKKKKEPAPEPTDEDLKRRVFPKRVIEEIRKRVREPNPPDKANTND